MSNPRRLKVEYVATDALEPYSANVRIHTPAQVQKIADSMDEYEWTVPILVDRNNVVIAGHGRLEAARLREFDEVPIIRLEHLTDEQARAYRIADNRLTELGEWDSTGLLRELESLRKLDFDIERTGFHMELLVPPKFEPVTAPAPGTGLDHRQPIECPECGHEFEPPPSR